MADPVVGVGGAAWPGQRPEPLAERLTASDLRRYGERVTVSPIRTLATHLSRPWQRRWATIGAAGLQRRTAPGWMRIDR